MRSAKNLLFLVIWNFALCCTVYGEDPSREILLAVIRTLQKQNIALRSEKLKADAEQKKQIEELRNSVKLKADAVKKQIEEFRNSSGMEWSTFGKLNYINMDLPAAESLGKIPRPAYIARRMEMLQKCASLGATVPSNVSRETEFSRESEVNIFGFSATSLCTVNHILPHSRQCRVSWSPCVQHMGGVDVEGPHAGETMPEADAAMFLNGVILKGNKNLHAHSSYVRSRENLFCMEAGGEYYDKDPSVGLYPILTEESCQGWDECGFKCMVVASSASVYCKIGAVEGEPGSWTVLRASDPDDLAQIKLALRTYNAIAVDTAARFAHLAAPSKAGTEAGMTSEKYIGEIRKSIADSCALRVPDPDNIPADAVFRVIEFGPARSDAEDSDKQPGLEAARRRLHPAPNPMLLEQRNFNVNVNHNYKEGRYETAPVEPNVFAAFWPSCLDVDPLAATCNLCRRRLSLCYPLVVEPFAHDDFQAFEMPDPAEDASEVSGPTAGDASEAHGHGDSDLAGADESNAAGGREAPRISVAPLLGLGPPAAGAGLDWSTVSPSKAAGAAGLLDGHSD